MTALRRDYPEYDEREQRDDSAEIEERLTRILQLATLRRLTEDEVRWLCVGCGIDIRNVT